MIPMIVKICWVILGLCAILYGVATIAGFQPVYTWALVGFGVIAFGVICVTWPFR